MSSAVHDAARGEPQLVYCHEAMHVQQRMQDAGWSADVERWESDEDSDRSEDEGHCDVVEGLQLSAQGGRAAPDLVIR